MLTPAAAVMMLWMLAPALAQEAPRVAYLTPNADYPLKLHILSVERHSHYSHGLTDTTSYGSGNLLGDTPVGFDWTTDSCPGGFVHNAQHEEFYQGRWKKQNQKVEILTVETGQSRPEKCTISVTLKSKPYDHNNPPPRLVTARN